MTSIGRADLVKQTLSSFRDKMFKSYENYRLIINIDHFEGHESLADPYDLLNNVVYKFFKKENVLYNIKSPDFTRATHWCFSQTESDVVFILQEDFELLYNVDFERVQNILINNPDIASVRFLQDKGDTRKILKNKKKVTKDCFAHNNLLSLNPCLFSKKHLDIITQKMNLKKGPERQFNPASSNGKTVRGFKFVTLDHENNPIVKDLGRPWRQIINGQGMHKEALAQVYKVRRLPA